MKKNFLTKILPSFFTITMLFSPSITAFANKKVYTVGVERIDYLPYYKGDSNGTYSGFAKEVLDLFSAEHNIDFRYRPVPVNRLFKEYLEGSMDFKFPDNPYWQANEKKGKTIIYSDKVVSYIDGVIVKYENKDNDIKFLNKLGKVAGFTARGYDDKKIDISDSMEITALLEKLKLGRVDGAYLNVNVAMEYMRKKLPDMNGKFVFNDKIPYNKSDYYFSTMNKDNREIIEKFNKFLIDRKVEIDDIRKKLGIKDYTQ